MLKDITAEKPPLSCGVKLLWPSQQLTKLHISNQTNWRLQIPVFFHAAITACAITGVQFHQIEMIKKIIWPLTDSQKADLHNAPTSQMLNLNQLTALIIYYWGYWCAVTNQLMFLCVSRCTIANNAFICVNISSVSLWFCAITVLALLLWVLLSILI